MKLERSLLVFSILLLTASAMTRHLVTRYNIDGPVNHLGYQGKGILGVPEEKKSVSVQTGHQPLDISHMGSQTHRALMGVPDDAPFMNFDSPVIQSRIAMNENGYANNYFAHPYNVHGRQLQKNNPPSGPSMTSNSEPDWKN